MLSRLGRFTVRRRRWVLAGSLLFFVAAGAIGGGVAEKLSNGGFEDPEAESTLASDRLEEIFGSGEANMVLLVESKSGSVDDPAAARAGAALTEQLAGEPDVAEAVSYWTLGGAPPLRNASGDKALVIARITGTENEIRDSIEELSPEYTIEDDAISARVGGQAEVFRQVGEQIEADLRTAETLTFPVVLILLVFVFGSVIAAGLPLVVGAISVVGTLLILSVIASMTEVSIFSLNLTTAMGLGLGIDYSLFIVSRFREELRKGLDVPDAVTRSVETAGRTVLFSAATVAISLAALLIFPLSFLRSFAYAGVAVVAVAAAGAVVALPALLAVIGHRIDKWTLIRHKSLEPGEGFWHRIAMFVMRRPLPIATAVIALLLFLGAPFFGVEFGLPDDRVLAADASSRSVQDTIREEFSSDEAAALSVVAPRVGNEAALEQDLTTYAARLSTLPGVARVDALTGSYALGTRVAPPNPSSQRFVGDGATWLSVVPTVEPMSEAGEQVVKDVRAAEAPFDVLVAGPSAQLVDAKDSLFSRMPWAGLLIAAVTFVVLFLMFGSILVPIKAVILNLLSLTATFGAMVWVFQEGNLSDALGFTATGTLDTTTPILMFCVAFGLSMDYEVFLLSRIKEEHDLGQSSQAAVAVGLERTGRIVTAAAALLAVVFIAFATSEITFIKLFGVGLALAVIMDATLIRAALVPSFMRLMGEANWWAPRWMRKIHDRWGISESGETPHLPVTPKAEEAR